jgi:O-antigen ligase
MSVAAETQTLIEASDRQAHIPANEFADRFLHVTLYITILSSFFVVIEPAPYEYLAAVLGFACVLARVSISRFVLPLLALLLIRELGGAIGLLKILELGWMRTAGDPTVQDQTVDYPDSMRFLAISFYLGLTGVLFGCIVAQDTMSRIATLRSAFMTAAVVTSTIGTLGYFYQYFNFIPGLDFFILDPRATGGFKGPNDMGSFLIAPVMWLIQGFIVDKVRLRDVVASVIIFTGLLLTFSRGAWGSGLVSAALLLYLLFLTQSDRRTRNRLLLCVVGGIAAALAIFMLLTSIDTVSQMLTERSHLQAYDVNADNRSRLLLQEDSLHEIFDHPLGMGPWGFAHATNWVSHNTFLSTTLNYGWIGGTAYLTLIVLTLAVGFRALWIRTSWQPFLIATYVSFIAMVLEGFWGDTDHWRHFYILVGCVWGLAAATQNVDWRERAKAVLDQSQLIRPDMRPPRQSLEKLT